LRCVRGDGRSEQGSPRGRRRSHAQHSRVRPRQPDSLPSIAGSPTHHPGGRGRDTWHATGFIRVGNRNETLDRHADHRQISRRAHRRGDGTRGGSPMTGIASIRGVVRVPGDKSISHRSLILAALSDGTSHISGLLRSADVDSTASVLGALGVRIEPEKEGIAVHGRGLRGLLVPRRPLDCGNSGTTARLMAGVLAAHPFDSTLIGDASLSRRPMRRVTEPLGQMGAHFTMAGDGDGLPLTIHGGTLASIGWNSPTASAQVKSAILLAALNAQVSANVTEPTRSRDHTERMLAARGIPIVVDGESVSIGVARLMRAMDTHVPGDPSSAAFFVALAALFPGRTLDMPDVCVNPTRTGFLDVVQRMGAVVSLLDSC